MHASTGGNLPFGCPEELLEYGVNILVGACKLDQITAVRQSARIFRKQIGLEMCLLKISKNLENYKPRYVLRVIQIQVSAVSGVTIRLFLLHSEK